MNHSISQAYVSVTTQSDLILKELQQSLAQRWTTLQ